MRHFRSTSLTLMFLLASALGASAQVNGTLSQRYLLQCLGPAPFFFVTQVNMWGPAPCVPPAPYDTVLRPAAGWGATPACTTGGSFDCAPGDTWDAMYPTTPGIGTGTTTVTPAVGFLTLTAAAPGPLPIPLVQVSGVVIQTVFGLPDPERTIDISVDGAALLNTAVANQAATVDINLQRESPTGTFVTIHTRRIFMNTSNPAVAQNTGTNYNIHFLDRPGTGVYSYRVTAQLIASTGPNVFLGDGNNATRTQMIIRQLK